MRRFIGSVSPPSFLPPTSTSPLSGVTSPEIIDTVVVFPAPFGPSRPIRRPPSSANETSSTATSGPYDLRRCVTSRMAMALGSSHGRRARGPISDERSLFPDEEDHRRAEDHDGGDRPQAD